MEKFDYPKTTKIEGAKLEVGDVVMLNSGYFPVFTQKKTVTTDENALSNMGDQTPKEFLVPKMVVAELFVEQNAQKTLTNTKTSQRVKEVSKNQYHIKAKCIWFYGGKYYEKPFWQDVLTKVEKGN